MFALIYVHSKQYCKGFFSVSFHSLQNKVNAYENHLCLSLETHKRN